MRFYQAAVLGVIQGVTEFLPVSSTAHLIALPRLWGWQRPGLSFDTSLHLGTLLAAGLYLRKDLQRLWASLKYSPAQSEGWELLLGTVPAGLSGLLLEETVETHLRSPLFMSAGMSIGALLMALAEHHSTHSATSQSRKFSNFIMGSSQALALFPGVSRSGITIATGLACGLERTQAARQSFLVGFPIIAAAGLFKLRKYFKDPPSQRELALLATAMAAATVSGYLSLRLLFQYLEKYPLHPVVLYRLGFALFLLSQKNSID
jgi:undecaprenyl-diphosphatase